MTTPRHERALLFTGFPGFIGARLIPRLAALRPDCAFELVVQRRFLELAESEVRRIEAEHTAARGRLRLVVGDITEPGLGIEPGRARALRRELVGAYHLAAVYDLAVARDLGMRVNVDGTRHLLDFLAGAKRLEQLDYVSTAYVSGRATGLYRETDLDVGQSFKNHYEETKFLAEKLVVESGLPAAIYRPGIVAGDSRTGETAKFDGPYYVVAAMEKLPSPGVFLRIGSGAHPANVVPVDFVIEALARLSASPLSRGRTYHLTDPSPLSALEMAELLARLLGKRFAFVPLPLAVARVVLGRGPFAAYLKLPVQALDYFDNPVHYDTSQANHDLAALDVACPRFPDYAQALVAFYRAHRAEVTRGAMV